MNRRCLSLGACWFQDEYFKGVREDSITVYCWILIVNYGVKIKMAIL